MAKSRAARAADPKTDLIDLAALAHDRPELRATVAANPSAYPDLLAWLGELGDPEVDAALAARGTTSADELSTDQISADHITTDAIRATDPKTPQDELATLAHAHPELRAAIAANPNAYDDLREWIAANPAAPEPATEPLGETVSGATTRRRPAAKKATPDEATPGRAPDQAPEPAAPPPTPASPTAAATQAAPRSRPDLSRAALRFAAVAYAAIPLTQLFFYLALAFPTSVLAYTASSYATWGLTVLVLGGLVLAAVFADVTTGIKGGAVGLAVLGAVLMFIPFGSLAAPFFFFLSWALTAGFRGWGFFGLLLVLAMVGLQILSNFVLVFGIAFLFVPAVVFAAAAVGVIVASAAWERAYLRRPSPVPIGAST